MIEGLKGVQVPIRDRFYRHVSRIPPELAVVSEFMTEDTDIDYGADQLALHIVPKTIRGCPFRLWVNERFCQGGVGEFGGFLFIPYLRDKRDETADYPDKVEQIVEAVVHGRVTEEVTRWRGKLLYTETWITSDGRKHLINCQHRWLWPFGMLLWKKTIETLTYESYLPD